MRILIIGANGFIGSYITAKLIFNQYKITAAVKDVDATKLKFPSINIIKCDFNHNNIEFWLDKLVDIDIVINAAGLLTSHGSNKIENVHINGPKALYEACISSKVKRIIHISALGIDEEKETDYALTKKNLDNYLSNLVDIDWVILKPSLVYAQGCYGGSSLLRGLSSLPYFIPLIGNGLQKFQPICMNDLTDTILFCVKKKGEIKTTIKPVGPEIITVKDMLINFRNWLGLPPARFIKIPIFIIKIITKIGDIFNTGPLNSTSYKMMIYPNIADRKEFSDYTSINPIRFRDALICEPATVQSLWHARLFFFKPIIKIIFALFWILSGVITIFNPEKAREIVGEIGLSKSNSLIITYMSCVLDIILGVFLLINRKTKIIYMLQFFTVICYSLILSFVKPLLWIDPLGSITKNIPILLLIIILMSIERNK